MTLEELILLCEKRKIVSLVGGGGKTSLMFFLAEQLAKRKHRVIVLTTTHMYKPQECYAGNADEVHALLEKGTYAVIGMEDSKDSAKLVFPEEAFYHEMKDIADMILVEADGAKRLPCKVPAEHEPVILPESNLVIGVMGMTALHQKLADCCFRFETDGNWLELPEDAALNEAVAVQLLSSTMGTRKSVHEREYVVALNQCDSKALNETAEEIASALWNEHKIKAVCCSMHQ